MSQPYAEVIGDPIAHSKSPQIHGFWLDHIGMAADYRACHVRRERLADYFADRRQDNAWRGCNITVPHKEWVADLLDDVDDRVRAIGAVNTVYRDPSGRLIGTNTDVDGIAEAVSGTRLVGKDVCMIGAGGAARAACSFLSVSRCAKVTIIARNPQKACEVARATGIDATCVPFEPDSKPLFKTNLLINATQLGMTGQAPMPAFILDELAEMAPDALVFDMVYSPLETALLKAARQRGLRTSDGLTMLVGQAARAFELFFGQPAPRQHDAQLRLRLTK